MKDSKTITYIICVAIVILALFYAKTYTYHCDQTSNIFGIESWECKTLLGGPVIKGVSAPQQGKNNNENGN